MHVPVVHQAEKSGGYVFRIPRGAPYFTNILQLWKAHAGSKRTFVVPPIAAIDIVADFVKHFPEDIL